MPMAPASKDEVEAVKWYRKAAEQNDVKAQYTLAGCYSKGEGIAKDPVEAVKWYRKAAEQNYAWAQWNLKMGGGFATAGGAAGQHGPPLRHR